MADTSFFECNSCSGKVVRKGSLKKTCLFKVRRGKLGELQATVLLEPGRNAEVKFGESFNLTPYASANTSIRFRVVQAHNDPHLYIDNVRVQTTMPIADGDDYDQLGHGTHVAGIMVGDGLLSNGSYRGIAPGADVLSLRVLDENGQGSTSDIIAALDWILANGPAYGIDVVNLSLGKAVEDSAVNDPLVQAAEAVWDAGYVVIAAAGN